MYLHYTMRGSPGKHHVWLVSLAAGSCKSKHRTLYVYKACVCRYREMNKLLIALCKPASFNGLFRADIDSWWHGFWMTMPVKSKICTWFPMFLVDKTHVKPIHDWRVNVALWYLLVINITTFNIFTHILHYRRHSSVLKRGTKKNIYIVFLFKKQTWDSFPSCVRQGRNHFVFCAVQKLFKANILTTVLWEGYMREGCCPT